MLITSVLTMHISFLGGNYGSDEDTDFFFSSSQTFRTLTQQVETCQFAKQMFPDESST